MSLKSSQTQHSLGNSLSLVQLYEVFQWLLYFPPIFLLAKCSWNRIKTDQLWLFLGFFVEGNSIRYVSIPSGMAFQGYSKSYTSRSVLSMAYGDLSKAPTIDAIAHLSSHFTLASRSLLGANQIKQEKKRGSCRLPGTKRFVAVLSIPVQIGCCSCLLPSSIFRSIY
jgi:hypothetical protein